MDRTGVLELLLVVKSPGWIAMSADARARGGDGNIELQGVVGGVVLVDDNHFFASLFCCLVPWMANNGGCNRLRWLK